MQVVFENNQTKSILTAGLINPSIVTMAPDGVDASMMFMPTARRRCAAAKRDAKLSRD